MGNSPSNETLQVWKYISLLSHSLSHKWELTPAEVSTQSEFFTRGEWKPEYLSAISYVLLRVLNGVPLADKTQSTPLPLIEHWTAGDLSISYICWCICYINMIYFLFEFTSDYIFLFFTCSKYWKEATVNIRATSWRKVLFWPILWKMCWNKVTAGLSDLWESL